MLSIDKLILRNFITYQKEVFSFDKLFDQDDILLVSGKNFDDMSFANDNGAGKTIIYQAIIFGLFNKTTRNSNKDILIGKSKKSMSVEILMSDLDDNNYWIKRYRKDKVHGNGVRFKINGKEKKKGTARELTNLILDILGLTYRRVLNTSIFESDDERSRFIYLGDKEGKELLAQMKGLEIFSKCYDVAKKEAANMTVKISELNNNIENYKLIMTRISNEIEENAILKQHFETEREQQIKYYKKLIKKEKKGMAEKQEEITNLFNSLDRYSNINNIKLKMSVLDNSAHTLHEQIAVIKSDRNKNKSILIVTKSNVSRAGLICNECGNKITKKALKSHMQHIQDETKGQDMSINVLTEKINDFVNKKNKLNKKLSIAKDTKEQNDENKNKMKILDHDISNSKKNIAERRQAIKVIENEKNTYQTRINKLKKELEKQRKSALADIVEKNHLDTKLKYADAWYDGYGKEGIQSHALKSTVAELNEEIRRISNMLTDGMVDIKLLTDKLQGNKKIRNIFEFEISDLNKKGLPFKEWSKGQKKRIEIIVSFALMNMENNLISQVFLDELFDGIDEVGITKIKNLLEEEARTKGKKFIVFSHSKDVKNLFYNQGHVKLKNGYSTFHLN